MLANLELSESIQKLGWTGPGTMFDMYLFVLISSIFILIVIK